MQAISLGWRVRRLSAESDDCPQFPADSGVMALSVSGVGRGVLMLVICGSFMVAGGLIVGRTFCSAALPFGLRSSDGVQIGLCFFPIGVMAHAICTMASFAESYCQ